MGGSPGNYPSLSACVQHAEAREALPTYRPRSTEPAQPQPTPSPSLTDGTRGSSPSPSRTPSRLTELTASRLPLTFARLRAHILEVNAYKRPLLDDRDAPHVNPNPPPRAPPISPSSTAPPSAELDSGERFRRFCASPAAHNPANQLAVSWRTRHHCFAARERHLRDLPRLRRATGKFPVTLDEHQYVIHVSKE